MKAIVIGATGATGKDLLGALLSDSRFSEVVIFVRKKIDLNHEKLTQHSINFDDENAWKTLVQGDVLFSCLGTTLAVAGSKEAQWKIDFDYQYNFAKVARENGVNQLVLVSSMGANPKSAVFYSKMKGALEEKVKELNFSRLVILRPPILDRKNTDRTAEIWSLKIIKFFNKLGLFSSQKPLKTELLAEAMLKLSLREEKGIFVLSAKDIWEVLEQKA